MAGKKNRKMVVTSNQLIESRQPFSLQEMRLFLCMLAEIDICEKKPKTYRLLMRDFAGERTDIYTRARQITLTFMSRVIEMHENGRVKQRNIMHKIDYPEKIERTLPGAYIEFKFHKDLYPHILDLKKRFTSYELTAILSFRSIFSIRIYQLLKADAYKDIKRRVFTIDELKNILMLENKYSRWADLKRYVIETAKRELKQSADIYFTYTTKKQGRSIYTIIFKIHEKPKAKPKRDKPYVDNYEEAIAKINAPNAPLYAP